MAGTRGKKITNEAGGQAYELDDEYRVLEEMKNTPKYWKKAKYEMIARLITLVPFNSSSLSAALTCDGVKTSLPSLKTEGMKSTMKKQRMMKMVPSNLEFKQGSQVKTENLSSSS